MRFLLLSLLVATAAVGCKKKDPEPMPAAAAPAPSIAWTWGVATFSGSRAAGETGTLRVPFTVTNASTTGLQFGTVAVNVFNGDTRVCSSKTTVTEKAVQGGSIEGAVELSCDYTLLPAGEKLPAKITALYTLGAEEREDKGVSVQLPFKR